MLKNILFLIVLTIIGLVGFGFYRTTQVQKSANQAIFLKGSLPTGLVGFYSGKVTGYTGSWLGKSFIPKDSAGINVFKGGERYPFKTYIGTGLRDTNVQVLKIDYSKAQNPWWVKYVLDELVQTSPNHYLGKIHIRIIPGISFAIGFFTLQK